MRCHSERLEEELFGIGGHLWLFHGVTQSEKKPSPEVFQIAVARLGLAPTACLVIEDAVNGIVAATGAGCFSAGVTTSFSKASLREASADFVGGSYSELKTLLTARETNGIGASGNHKPQ